MHGFLHSLCVSTPTKYAPLSKETFQEYKFQSEVKNFSGAESCTTSGMYLTYGVTELELFWLSEGIRTADESSEMCKYKEVVWEGP